MGPRVPSLEGETDAANSARSLSPLAGKGSRWGPPPSFAAGPPTWFSRRAPRAAMLGVAHAHSPAPRPGRPDRRRLDHRRRLAYRAPVRLDVLGVSRRLLCLSSSTPKNVELTEPTLRGSICVRTPVADSSFRIYN